METKDKIRMADPAEIEMLRREVMLSCFSSSEEKETPVRNASLALDADSFSNPPTSSKGSNPGGYLIPPMLPTNSPDAAVRCMVFSHLWYIPMWMLLQRLGREKCLGEYYKSELPNWCRCRDLGRRGKSNDIIRAAAVKEMLPGMWQAVVTSVQELGKTAYPCDSHACHPGNVLFCFIPNFPVTTNVCNPERPFFSLYFFSGGEFPNPSICALARVFFTMLVASWV